MEWVLMWITTLAISTNWIITVMFTVKWQIKMQTIKKMIFKENKKEMVHIYWQNLCKNRHKINLLCLQFKGEKLIWINIIRLKIRIKLD